MSCGSMRLTSPAAFVTVMIGPNGSGKSTLLGALQLVLHPTRGTLTPRRRTDGRESRSRRGAGCPPPFRRALLLSMSVQANVELPLRLRGVDRRRRRELAEHWLERFGIARSPGGTRANCRARGAACEPGPGIRISTRGAVARRALRRSRRSDPRGTDRRLRRDCFRNPTDNHIGDARS